MSHINAISSGIYTHLAFSSQPQTAMPSDPTVITEWAAKFAAIIDAGTVAAATSAYQVKNIREFPSVGTPANIVNVPVYGQKTSSQIQGQADAPTLEFTLNYVGNDWQTTANYFGSLVGTGDQFWFRLALAAGDPVLNSGSWAAGAADIGVVANSQYFWMGRLEAITVSPQLTDAIQATLTVSTQSEFYGAFTE